MEKENNNELVEFKVDNFEIEEAARINSRQMEEEIYNKAIDNQDKLVALASKVDDYYCEGETSHKFIIALNDIYQRTLTQYQTYSLRGISEYITHSIDKDELTENGYISDNQTPISKHVAYIKIKPEEYFHDSATITISEALNNIVQPFKLRSMQVELRVFIETRNPTAFTVAKSSIQNAMPEAVIISKFPSDSMLNKGYIGINEYPDVSPQEIIDNFISAFDLFAYRREHIYINKKLNVPQNNLSLLDLQLIAHDRLINFVVDNNSSYSLANHFTKYWIGMESLKFMNEHFVDFFNTPSIVLVQGVSHLWGVITGREIKADCVKLGEDGSEEKVTLELRSPNTVEGIYDHDVLTKYLSMSIENTRDRLVKISGDVYRVERFQRKFTIKGKNEMMASNRGGKAVPLSVVQITDMGKVKFLTPYYDLAMFYELAHERKGVIPAKLPDNIRSYFLRQIVRNGGVIINQSERDSTEAFDWFKPINSNFYSTLQTLDKDFPISAALGSGLSASLGLTSRKLYMKWEDLKCLQAP